MSKAIHLTFADYDDLITIWRTLRPYDLGFYEPTIVEGPDFEFCGEPISNGILELKLSHNVGEDILRLFADRLIDFEKLKAKRAAEERALSRAWVKQRRASEAAMWSPSAGDPAYRVGQPDPDWDRRRKED